jgi:hypothetical protein
MGYLGSSGGSGGYRQQPSVSIPRQKAPEPSRIEANLDPSTPVDTVFGGIGGLFTGVVGAGVGVANALSKVPVIGDVGKAVAGGLGAFGEVGAKGILQVKDVAKAGLDLISIPGKAVQAGAAAVRVSGIFGEQPADVKAMLNNGKSFTDVVGSLVQQNRGFSDNQMANLGWSLVTDPLNYVNIFGPVAKAGSAARLANVERQALSKADDILAATKRGVEVAPEYASMVGKRPGDIRAEMLSRFMTKEDAAFLNRWRIAGSLYDATLGKAGKGLSALVDGARGPVLAAVVRSFDQAPRQILDGLEGANQADLAAAYGRSFGRGLVQATVFSVSRIFSRGETNLGRLRANAVIQRVTTGRENDLADSIIAKELTESGLVSGEQAGLDLVQRISGMDDAARRRYVREVADEYAASAVKTAGAAAGGDYKKLMEIGGIRIQDTLDETTSFLSEGSRRYTTLPVETQLTIFLEKSRAAMNPYGRDAVRRMIGGEVVSSGKNVDGILRDIFMKASPEDQARMVHIAEIAAYGAQATSTATIRNALKAVAINDKAKLEDILGKPITVDSFNKLKAILETDAGRKLLRLNLVRANTLTEDRITSLLDVADGIRNGQKFKQAALAAFPDDMRDDIAKATNLDELAQAVIKFFPDISVTMGKASQGEWSSISAALTDILDSGNFVRTASAEELASLKSALDTLSPGAGSAAIKSIEAGRYSFGFSPEGGVVRRAVARGVDDGFEVVDEPISPFVDNIDDFVEGIDESADAFRMSGMRRLATRWLRPITSGQVQQQQVDNTIKIVLDGGGSILQAKKLFAAVNETALRRKISPRALVSDENAIRQIMQNSLGSKFDDIVAKADPRFKRPSVVLMKMFAGSSEVVGSAQALTGMLKTKIPQLAIITDNWYPQIKFKLNPLFYIQEAIESPFFNYLRGIQRQLNGGEYVVTHGWAKYLPFVKSPLGGRLGLSRAVGPEIKPELAALSLGAGDSALRADLDIAEAVIFLQGKEASALMATEYGRTMAGAVRESLNRGSNNFIRTLMNPYPMKNMKKLEMTYAIAAEEFGNRIRYSMPEQWIAMTKTYQTSNPRMVMAYFMQDVTRGWVNPTKVVDASRPIGFAFAGKGSIDAASKLDTEIARIAAMPRGTVEEMSAVRVALMNVRGGLLADSAAVGNEVTAVEKALVKLVNADETADVDKLIEAVSGASSSAARVAQESVNDFNLLDDAISKIISGGKSERIAALGGFPREKIAASLARYRSYGTDFPGMEAVMGKLRSGKDLDTLDVRALELSLNTLLDAHGPEEMLLQAFRQSLKDANDAANRIHFYNPNRSAFERSLNHPYLAFYPLSYMIGKVIPEFSRALFFKFPFTNVTRPFAGYEIVHEVSDFIAMKVEEDPKFADVLLKSDFLFILKQLFPGVPGDISVSAPRWANRYYAQLQRSQRPAQGGREPASADPGYLIRGIAEQAKDQGLFGNIELFGGAVSEAWDFLGDAVDFNESGK